MSYYPISRQLVFLVVLLLSTAFVFVRTTPNSFSGNQLLLDGKPANPALFSIRTKGSLALLAGNSADAEAAKIPFRIYLRRGNKVINQGASNTSRSVFEVEVSTVLSEAKHGDFLVIEPVRASDADAWRTIRLIDYFYTDWLLFPNRRDGC